MIECKTWRHRGHFEGDPAIYKDDKDQEEWLKKDPIPRLAARIVELKYATQDELDKIEAEAKAKIEEAVKFAQDSPLPEPEEVLTDVYAD